MPPESIEAKTIMRSSWEQAAASFPPDVRQCLIAEKEKGIPLLRTSLAEAMESSSGHGGIETAFKQFATVKKQDQPFNNDKKDIRTICGFLAEHADHNLDAPAILGGTILEKLVYAPHTVTPANRTRLHNAIDIFTRETWRLIPPSHFLKHTELLGLIDDAYLTWVTNDFEAENDDAPPAGYEKIRIPIEASTAFIRHLLDSQNRIPSAGIHHNANLPLKYGRLVQQGTRQIDLLGFWMNFHTDNAIADSHLDLYTGLKKRCANFDNFANVLADTYPHIAMIATAIHCLPDKIRENIIRACRATLHKPTR